MSYKFKVLILGLIMFLLFAILFISFNTKSNNTYNDNLIIMETKGKEYIKYNLLQLTSEKVITLEELYEINILPRLYYKFYECNDKSYIIIKPRENFYEMTTTLICDDRTEVIKSYFN